MKNLFRGLVRTILQVLAAINPLGLLIPEYTAEREFGFPDCLREAVQFLPRVGKKRKEKCMNLPLIIPILEVGCQMNSQN